MEQYRKPQQGNPHQLSINQHVYPRASLNRFANPNGRVKVRLLHDRRIIEVEPGHEIFCTKRSWDQRAESLVGKQVEDAFQMITDEVLSGRKNLGSGQHETVTYFRSLWQLRAHYRDNRLRDTPTPGVTPSDLTIDQCEMLESKYITYVEPNGNFPGRMLTGLYIQMGLDQFATHNAGARWGVQHATKGEFMLPDQFGEVGIVPMSPKYALLIGAPDSEISFDDVRNFNRAALREAKRYVVARDFAVCPV